MFHSSRKIYNNLHPTPLWANVVARQLTPSNLKLPRKLGVLNVAENQLLKLNSPLLLHLKRLRKMYLTLMRKRALTTLMEMVELEIKGKLPIKLKSSIATID